MKIGRLFYAAILIGLISCSDDESSDFIKDKDGVVISLTWNTGGSEEEALSDTDLDLYIYDAYLTEVNYSVSENLFEETVFDAFHPDGEYIVSIYVSAIDVATDYKLKIEGVNDNTAFKDEGTIGYGHVSESNIYRFTIVKNGTKFLVRKITAV